MTSYFTSSFLSAIGKIIAVIVMILFVIFFGYMGFKTYDKYIKISTNEVKPNAAITINKPEYKPSIAISTSNQNELKVNHEKLTLLIDSNNAIISDYYK